MNEIVRQLLIRDENDARQVVVMTCGIAGSGKSTLAKAIVAEYPRFTRISIDQIIFEKYGICGRDYPIDKYEEYSEEADLEYRRRFRELLRDRRDIVLDRSFYSKEDRDEFSAMIEEGNARKVLVVLKASNKEILWKRITERRAKGVNADCALDITREILDQYWNGFDWPEGEGEVVIDFD